VADTLEKRVSDLEYMLAHVPEDLDARFAGLDVKFAELRELILLQNNRFTKLEARFNEQTAKLTIRLDELAHKVDGRGSQLDELARKVDAQGGQLTDLAHKADTQAGRIDDLSAQVKAIHGKLDEILARLPKP
jgi:chromosome segregation ATPase